MSNNAAQGLTDKAKTATASMTTVIKRARWWEYGLGAGGGIVGGLVLSALVLSIAPSPKKKK